MRRRPTKHTYLDDGTQDGNGHGRCRHCALPESNERHNLPPVTADQLAAESRRIGEDTR